MTIDAIRLQRNLGVTADGVIGRGTLAALFRKMGCPSGRDAEYGLAANVHFRTYGILDNGLRLAHFMGQTAHESGGFVYLEEIWGPTAAQRGYEGRADLGNTVTGDGFRYKGRAALQVTGRANYRSMGQFLGIDLESNPALLAIPSLGLLASCAFWATRGLNELADLDDNLAVTRKINGGTNGLDDRARRLTIAKGLIL